MFYWLDNFALCLPPFFQQGQDVVSNPTSYTDFLTFYAEIGSNHTSYTDF
jgi:hypothetical protein